MTNSCKSSSSCKKACPTSANTPKPNTSKSACSTNKTLP
nr:MAG TPA: Epoxyqueuosine reductase [Caudoviricetes sp.]